MAPIADRGRVSVKERRLEKIEVKIRDLHQEEISEVKKLRRKPYQLRRWILMLYHEVLKDDVTIRAESLSYFTLFSIMPLMAGVFLLLGFFSQWGPVQNEFQDFLLRILQPIPEEHRMNLMKFILDFKDEYLLRLNQKSTSIGVFALGVLIWITAKVFFNVESLMNRIWSVSEDRSWFDRIQNFVFGTVILPFFALTALSLPGLIGHFGAGKAGGWLESGLPMLFVFLLLTFVFRYFPNVRVKWQSALWGAGVSSVLFLAANNVLKIYFKFGTDTAYGKAGVLPIIAFFIYVMWLLFILGAEVSFLLQNRSAFIGRKLSNTTLSEAALLIELLHELQSRFKKKQTPMTANDFAERFRVPLAAIQKLLYFMRSREILAEAVVQSRSEESAYVLLCELGEEDLGIIVKDYLNIDNIEQTFDVRALFKRIQ